MPPGLVRLPNGKLVDRSKLKIKGKKNEIGLLAKPTYSTTPKKKESNPVTGFLHSATNFVKDVVEWEKKDIKRTVKVGKKVYGALDDYSGEVIRNAESQIPGTPQWGKRRKREAAQARRAGKRLDRMPVNQLATGPKIMELLRAGAFVARREGALDDIPELNRVFGGVENILGTRVHPMNRQYTGDIGFEDRIPALISKKTGRVDIGARGESHGGLMRTKHQSDTLGPTDYDKYNQMMVQSKGGTLQGDLDFGAYSGNPPPANQAHVYRLLDYLLRDYPDELIKARWGINGPTPLLAKAVKKNGPERTARLMQTMGVHDPVEMEKVLREFQKAERLRKRPR